MAAPSSPHIAAPSSPHIAAPSSPHIAAPSSPHIAAPSSPHIAAPSSPHIAAPSSPHIAAPSRPHIAADEAIKRFCYISDYAGRFVASDPDRHLNGKAHGEALQFAKSNPNRFIELIAEISEDPLLVRRANIFYLLAKVLTDNNLALTEEARLLIRNSVLQVVKCDEDFFHFIKYYTNARGGKICKSLRKLITQFYNNKQPKDFLATVTKQNSHHGWSHQDLFRLCHYKSDSSEILPMVRYALYGLRKLQEDDTDCNKEFIDVMKKTYELRVTQDVERAAILIKELQLSVERVNTRINKKPEIWLAAIPSLSVRELLRNLPRLYRLGFLKTGSPILANILLALNDEEKIRKDKLHPLEVFGYLKLFEKGGKCLDPQLLEYLASKKFKPETMKRLTEPVEPKCPGIVQNINKCLTLSYVNIQRMKKNFMVTIDPMEKESSYCMQNRRVKCLEAAYAVARYVNKMGRNTTTAFFQDNHISILDLSSCFNSGLMLEKVKEVKTSHIWPAAPFNWAIEEKKRVDVFIHIMSCSWQKNLTQELVDKLEKPGDALDRYCKTVNAPNTKLVRIFPGGISNGTPTHKNILTMCGFSADTPWVLEAFCRERFH